MSISFRTFQMKHPFPKMIMSLFRLHSKCVLYIYFTEKQPNLKKIIKKLKERIKLTLPVNFIPRTAKDMRTPKSICVVCSVVTNIDNHFGNR